MLSFQRLTALTVAASNSHYIASVLDFLAQYLCFSPHPSAYQSAFHMAQLLHWIRFVTVRPAAGTMRLQSHQHRLRKQWKGLHPKEYHTSHTPYVYRYVDTYAYGHQL